MTWTDTRDAIQAAIPAAAPFYAETGRLLVADFGRQLRDFSSVGRGLPQPVETAEHIEWRSSTMPGFIAGLLEVAALLDGAPAGTVGGNFTSELKRARERLSGAIMSASPTLQAFARRAVGARAPKEPAYFPNDYERRSGKIISGGQEQTVTASSIAKSLDRLETEATLWLSLVAP